MAVLRPRGKQAPRIACLVLARVRTKPSSTPNRTRDYILFVMIITLYKNTELSSHPKHITLFNNYRSFSIALLSLLWRYRKIYQCLIYGDTNADQSMSYIAVSKLEHFHIKSPSQAKHLLNIWHGDEEKSRKYS